MKFVHATKHEPSPWVKVKRVHTPRLRLDSRIAAGSATFVHGVGPVSAHVGSLLEPHGRTHGLVCDPHQRCDPHNPGVPTTDGMVLRSEPMLVT